MSDPRVHILLSLSAQHARVIPDAALVQLEEDKDGIAPTGKLKEMSHETLASSKNVRFGEETALSVIALEIVQMCTDELLRKAGRELSTPLEERRLKIAKTLHDADEPVGSPTRIGWEGLLEGSRERYLRYADAVLGLE